MKDLWNRFLRQYGMIVMLILCFTGLGMIAGHNIKGADAAKCSAGACVPTELQMAKLQLKQRDAIDANRARNQALAALQQYAVEVEKENGWPSTLLVDYDKLTFTEPPKPTPPAPAEPPKDAAKPKK